MLLWQVLGLGANKAGMEHPIPRFELSEHQFLALLVRAEPVLRGYARTLVPDWDLVDEAIQEATITMWQKRDQLESEDGFVPWARVILRFKCLRQLEKLRSRQPILSDEVLEKLAERSERRDPMELSVRERAFHSCFKQFSREHRELLLAPHHSLDSVVRLAERRGKSPNALYKLLARLRNQLTECVHLRISTEAK
ncbi:MAG: hypothetical protein CBB71_07630 [Rhodopirellula sp. TMED11]|nr:MAG: hypothetical protein CBB71_07630 [Rhodopirellula sp. TMED11]